MPDRLINSGIFVRRFRRLTEARFKAASANAVKARFSLSELERRYRDAFVFGDVRGEDAELLDAARKARKVELNRRASALAAALAEVRRAEARRENSVRLEAEQRRRQEEQEERLAETDYLSGWQMRKPRV